jgi:hypothetical protein
MNLVAHAAGLVAAGGLVTAAAPAKVAFVASGHSPKVKTRWSYSVTVERDGKPAAATLTAQIVDPIGGTHPIQFGSTTRDVKAFPFKGSFHDFVIWPAESRGIPLTFRLIVRSGPTTKVIGYRVTPH